ncbi:MAG TPA: isocitrate/isopropylmalate family dehydrogenase, partial [Kofleriaceae bacterium]
MSQAGRAPKSTYELVLLPGDGIGIEVIADARALLELIGPAIGVGFALEEIPCGGKFYLEHGTRDWPEGAEDKCAAADAILLGAVGWAGPDGAPVTMPDGKMAGWSPVIGNRMKLDLYANVRPVRCLPGTKHGISGQFASVWKPESVDMVILRENTEGLYSGIGERTRDRATDLRVITKRASERVIRKAFEISRDRGRGAPGDGKQRVTCIVKHNVLHGCRLFLDVFREVGAEFPGIDQDVAIVDAFAMFVLTQPERYDVCVTTNMFGDILTDLASVLQGGMGMAVGCNVGDDHAMFEPIHGSAPPLAGKDKANPMAMLLATGECLAWLGHRHADQRLLRAADAIA